MLVVLELLLNGFAQDACPLSMDDADLRQVGEEGIVEEDGQNRTCLQRVHTAQVELR